MNAPWRARISGAKRRRPSVRRTVKRCKYMTLLFPLSPAAKQWRSLRHNVAAPSRFSHSAIPSDSLKSALEIADTGREGIYFRARGAAMKRWKRWLLGVGIVLILLTL